jgi:hypothetical protein
MKRSCDAKKAEKAVFRIDGEDILVLTTIDITFRSKAVNSINSILSVGAEVRNIVFKSAACWPPVICVVSDCQVREEASVEGYSVLYWGIQVLVQRLR